MFASEDRPEQQSARACSSSAFAESLSVSATFGQTPTYATHHPVAPRREVVIPRPGGRGICFSSAPEHNPPLVFNNLRAIFLAKEPQPPHCQSVAHSSILAKNITAIFPTTSILSHRSSAPERNATPVLSFFCELFRKTEGGGYDGPSNSFRITFLGHPTKQPPWNHTLAKTGWGWGGSSPKAKRNRKQGEPGPLAMMEATKSKERT